MGSKHLGRGFLGQLARDVRGNTIAIMAAAMMPLAGLIGGGVDMSRLYLTKTRLQQACDAGALAGRKAMGGGGWTTGSGNDSTNDKAEKMFAVNFTEGQYGTGALTMGFTEDNGVVTGTASAAVPMTIMKVFGMQERTVAVTCTAKMEIPNTDVMFVLDVTGSMQCASGQSSCYGPAPTGTSKIEGLRSAVLCFYESLERVNTTETCGNDPSATSSSTTAQIRIGFVPYSVNVNVGRLLPNDDMADSWTYQSRSYGWDGTTYDTSSSTTNWTYSAGSTVVGSRTDESSCPSDTVSSSDLTGPTSTTTAPDGTVTTSYTVTRTTTGIDYECTRSTSHSHGTTTTTYKVTPTTYNNYQETQTHSTVSSPHYAYTYQPRTFDVSGLKAGGSSWNNSISLDVGTAGATTSVSWPGCIEERHTFQNTDGTPSDDWSPIPSDALDMDVNLVPSSLTAYNSYWGPQLPGAEYARYSWGYSNCSNSGRTTSSVTTSCNSGSTSASCPTAAKKLTEYDTPTALETYVASLSPGGATYHDIGMLWGARLLSPTGIFSSENAFTPSGQTIQRHLIFMTDGDTNTSDTDYSAYGIGYYDRRQASYDASDTQMDDMTNARLAALCTAVKNMNITLWVISYGGGVNTDTETRLSDCATPGHYYAASDGAALIDRFRQIASEISELRLMS